MAAPGSNVVMPLMKPVAPRAALTSGVVLAPPPRRWLGNSVGRSTWAWRWSSAGVMTVSVGVASYRRGRSTPS